MFYLKDTGFSEYVMERMDLARIKKNLKKNLTGLPEVSVALLGDSPTQLLSVAIRGLGVEERLNIHLYEADYNQIDFEVLNTSSQLYSIKPRVVVIHQSTQKLWRQFCAIPESDRYQFAEFFLEVVNNYFSTINDNINTNIIYFNFPELDDRVFGNFGNKIRHSFLYQLRKINLGLMDLASSYKNLFINDVSFLHARVGEKQATSSSIFVNSGMVYSVDFIPIVAKGVLDIINSINGKIRKCLIMDLDNTLWGGVIGDDGMEGIQIGSLGIGEAFTQLQLWIKELKNRGIILAVCSKNNEEIAREPFENHEDMILKISDIAVFIANWDNKADNIRYIQSVLNIGFDSMVFIDDNPAERKIVLDNIPNIIVPNLPEDPAEYLGYLQCLNLFETTSVTDEDKGRTEQYQQEAKRALKKKSFVDEDEFLKSLEMTVEVLPFNTRNIPRIAQLTQRSNQFNLRTIRYTEDDIKRIVDSGDYYTLSYRMRDMFGDYGLVSVIILRKLSDKEVFIDTWIMSCRVLKRGLESLVLNSIVDISGKNGFRTIIGEYIPTSKNRMVEEHYSLLGFSYSEERNLWILNIDDFKDVKHYIELSSK